MVADALADAKIPSLRFNFPYKAAGRRRPDRPPVLDAAVREATAELARRTQAAGRPARARRALDGRAHLLAGRRRPRRPVPALGLALLGYPLHPPGKPDTLRVEHFTRLTMPVLFASGTRDAFGTPAELKRHAKKIKGRVDLPLGRDRRSRLQAAEGERADGAADAASLGVGRRREAVVGLRYGRLTVRATMREW